MSQRSEDPARGLRAIWHGPTGAWRWWFDATYTEWAIGMGVALVAGVVLWLVLPMGVLMVLFAGAWGRWIAYRASDAQLLRITRKEGQAGRTRLRRIMTGLVLAVEVLFFSSPVTWLLPMGWYLAAPGAVYVAYRLVRMARPYLDSNRPVGYWARALRDTARGPRPQRGLLTIIPIVELPAVKAKPVKAKAIPLPRNVKEIPIGDQIIPAALAEARPFTPVPELIITAAPIVIDQPIVTPEPVARPARPSARLGLRMTSGWVLVTRQGQVFPRLHSRVWLMDHIEGGY